ncbi:MAG: hypothetical protein H6975_00385 [Gammaproteobacteria bacterium]|nr:hypothetical protein [Gammaproteobacteria bacterium]
MNDATELEPSLAGAIDFFQNLHRKMGALETDTYAQHDQLHSLSTSLVTLEQDRQSDRQMLISLTGDLSAQDARLLKLQTDSQALDKQLTTVETLVAHFQEQQQEVRQTLAALTGDLQTQSAALRQELESALTQQTAPDERVSALEARLASQTREQLGLLGSCQALEKGANTLQTRVTALEARIEQYQEQFEPLEKTDRAHRQQLEEFAAIVETQHKRLLQLEVALENLDQSTQSTTQWLTTLKTDLKRQSQAFETNEPFRQQLQDQQRRLDALTESSSALQQDLASFKTGFESQRDGLTDAAQARQELQTQQERVKHLETLVGKVSADTNSTRQILNVLQTDLTMQSNTLRELDQSWRDSLASHHDRLSQLEITASGSAAQTTAFPAKVSEFTEQLHTLQQQMRRFESTLDRLRETPEPDSSASAEAALDGLRQDLSAQAEMLDETQQLAWSQIQDLQQRLSEAEATLDSLRQIPEPDGGADTKAALDHLRQDLATQTETVEDIQQLAWSQIQDLQQRLSEAEATLDHLHSTSATESSASTNAEAALDRLRQDLAVQTETLDETQQLAWSQIQDLQQRLSEAEATLDHLGQPSETHAGTDLEATLASLRHDLSTQTNALGELQDATRRQFADLNAAFEAQQQEAQKIAGQLGQMVTLEQLQAAGQSQIQQLQALQHRLGATEATLDVFRQTSETETDAEHEAAIGNLRQDLLAQGGALDKLRDTMQQQLADLSAAFEAQQQKAQGIASEFGNLQQEIQQIQQQDSPNTVIEQRLETAEVYSQKLQQDLESLQDTVTALETRLSSQSQAFSGHFEQFRSLNAEIHALQQKLAKLEASPSPFGSIDQELASHQRDIAQLRKDLERIQVDSQQMGEMIQQGGAESPVAEMTARLDEQQERLNELATIVEGVRVDAKSAQETVVTMATNVAKRIHEIQNLLVATETTQGERLQDVEQKLIWLQAALETMETPKTKSRRWFSMPASLTSILLTVGAASVAILAEAIWVID